MMVAFILISNTSLEPNFNDGGGAETVQRPKRFAGFPLKTSATFNQDTKMKIASLFGVAIVCLATSAMAYDMTYIVPVKAHHTESSRVELPSGSSSVIVRSGDKTISCSVTDTATGNPAAPDQSNVTACYFNARGLTASHSVYVKVTNESSEELQVTVQVVDSK
jgi:hypothetical protein